MQGTWMKVLAQPAVLVILLIRKWQTRLPLACRSML